jgi:glycosyltransferase involved in cell wall biosynthesis
LEAIACGIPVIAMKDSPKNCEFVAESGYGVICDPNPAAIKDAYLKVMGTIWDEKVALNYIKKWTPQAYADAILLHLI